MVAKAIWTAMLLACFGASASAMAVNNLDPSTRYGVNNGLAMPPDAILGHKIFPPSDDQFDNTDARSRYGVNTGLAVSPQPLPGHVVTPGKKYTLDNTDPRSRYGVNHGLHDL